MPRSVHLEGTPQCPFIWSLGVRLRRLSQSGQGADDSQADGNQTGNDRRLLEGELSTRSWRTAVDNLRQIRIVERQRRHGIKYFSGVGTYTKTIQAPADWFKPGTHLWIDLGDVRNLADVTVNGKPLGIVWHIPYRVDATSALKPGANELTIKVTTPG